MLVNDYFLVKNPEFINTPALLFYPHLINENIQQMISLVDGNVNQLRPHVKTHKTSEIIKLHLSHGIEKFKCATIAEAEMVAESGGSDILLAIQPSEINMHRLLQLVSNFPKTAFSTIVDNHDTIQNLSEVFSGKEKSIQVYVDIDCGMQRTGIQSNKGVLELWKLMEELPGVFPVGLHIYDGHIHHSDFEERKAACRNAFKEVFQLIEKLKNLGFGSPKIVAGGTPTFTIHSKNKSWEVSPGTSVLWDWGYEKSLPDLHFNHAALLLTRVLSKPDENLICLDLGYKSIASEQPQPRVNFPQIAHYKIVNHSEEHMVIETKEASKWKIGEVLYGIPQHICPTCCLYEEALVVNNKEVTDSWKITARNKKITY